MTLHRRPGRSRPWRPTSRTLVCAAGGVAALIVTVVLSLPVSSQDEISSASPATPDGRRQAFLDLTTTLRLLAIAAHPGDEDLETLAMVRRGHGVRTRVHYLTAGEAGKPTGGGKPGAALGIRRVAEARQSAAVVGAVVTHALLPDVPRAAAGAESSFPATWKRSELIESLVRAIREFRPHVVLIASREGFRRVGTARVEDPALHAHVYDGLLEAVKAAADRAQFDDHLQDLVYPWKVSRVFAPAAPSEADAALPVGDRDARLGARYAEIAAKARSNYRAVSIKATDAIEKAYYRQVHPAPSARAETPAVSLFAGLTPFDRNELGLTLDADYRRVRSVEDKIIRAGFKLLEVGEQEKEATKLLLEATKGLYELNGRPYTRRRLDPGEFLDEIGYQHFFRMRGPDLTEAMRQVLGMSFSAKAEASPVAPGETYQVSAVVKLTSGKALENATIRIERSAAAASVYVEQSNRRLTRDTPIRAFFKVRVDQKAVPTAPAEDAFDARRLHEDMTCVVSARLGENLVAYTVPLRVPPIVAPVQIGLPRQVAVDASGKGSLALKFKTQGPLYGLGGRPKDGVMVFKLAVAKAPPGVDVQPKTMEIKNRRSGYQTEHAFTVTMDGSAAPPTAPVIFEVQRWKGGEPAGPVFKARTTLVRSVDSPK